MEPDTANDRYASERAELLESLREKGISDKRVLAALGTVPRERFVVPERRDQAYADIALPFMEGQTVSQPYTVAYQSSLLEVAPHMKVLEIGTGSGYQAAVLAQLGGTIYTIERIRALFDHLPTIGMADYFRNVHFLYGDGYEGYPPEAPYHRILLTAATEQVPDALLQQLAPRGLLVAPVGVYNEGQVMTRIYKDDMGRLQTEHFGSFSFVPMIRGRN
jgi:protein-L-isoaspartate(D-aspartate) O-methyltransferase